MRERGRKRRRLRKRTRKGCVSETQRVRDGWVVRATRAAVSGIDLRPLRGREDLVQVAIAAEGARPDVDEGDAAVGEVAFERPLGARLELCARARELCPFFGAQRGKALAGVMRDAFRVPKLTRASCNSS